MGGGRTTSRRQETRLYAATKYAQRGEKILFTTSSIKPPADHGLIPYTFASVPSTALIVHQQAGGHMLTFRRWHLYILLMAMITIIPAVILHTPYSKLLRASTKFPILARLSGATMSKALVLDI
ncbi:hypothetical protein M441DRAFT_359024 [Trichoderma asperellum CBS 433.97]|uniref:Uncharacterized protein n=1 Tax=Trichoderma asperellum (strain ATCC 204424 / CBS 433.97 / NBRC 101777) TaxID=1042311 RepID=A0A2T3ZDA7_TRIA4|nr:hypothetical protein M441DRAFT_359024 [Trichoderma asperellum CBS 433.97]PTB42786.1 hypothetical protein M441DRAFT_359024 [Trichoderma asperellum CBS 433.97]